MIEIKRTEIRSGERLSQPPMKVPSVSITRQFYWALDFIEHRDHCGVARRPAMGHRYRRAGSNLSFHSTDPGRAVIALGSLRHFFVPCHSDLNSGEIRDTGLLRFHSREATSGNCLSRRFDHGQVASCSKAGEFSSFSKFTYR